MCVEKGQCWAYDSSIPGERWCAVILPFLRSSVRGGRRSFVVTRHAATVFLRIMLVGFCTR